MDVSRHGNVFGRLTIQEHFVLRNQAAQKLLGFESFQRGDSEVNQHVRIALIDLAEVVVPSDGSQERFCGPVWELRYLIALNARLGADEICVQKNVCTSQTILDGWNARKLEHLQDLGKGGIKRH